MPYKVNNTSTAIIDGDEMNAGDRVFSRDYRNIIIDGAIIGTAGDRQFANEHKMFALLGGPGNGSIPHVLYTATIAVTGQPMGGDIYGHPITYCLDGKPSSHSSAPVALRSHTAIVIEDAPQETPP